MIPPTQVCMGCHAMVKTDSARLAPVRASWESGKPVEWVQVHKLPDHAYFDHSAHLAAGVGCVDVPRPRRPDGGRARRDAARNGLVPRLPPRPEAEPSAEGSDHQHGVEAGDGRRLDRPRRQSAASIARGVTDEPPRTARISRPPQDGAKVFWKSLEDKERPELAQKRAETEVAAAAAAAAADVDAREASPRQERRGPRRRRRDVSIGRRGFMFFAGATAALAAEGCARRPVEKIMPYSKAPEHVLPGVANHYAIGPPVPQRCDRHRRREPRRPPDEDRGQPEAPVEPRRDRPLDAGRHLRALRSRSLGHADARRTCAGHGGRGLAPAGDVGRARRRPRRHRADLAGRRRREAPHPRRADQLADVHPSPRRAPGEAPAGEGPHVGVRERRERARRRAASRSVRSSTSPPTTRRRRSSSRSTATSSAPRPGNVRATTRVRRGSQARERRDRLDEPALRRRADLHGHGHERRPPPPPRGAGRRALPARARDGARRDKHAIDLGARRGARQGRRRSRASPPSGSQVVAKELAGARAKSVLVAGTRQPRARSRARSRAQRRARQRGPHGQLLPAGRPPRGGPDGEPQGARRRHGDERGRHARHPRRQPASTTRPPTSSSASASRRSARRSTSRRTSTRRAKRACGTRRARTSSRPGAIRRAFDGTVAIQQPLIAPLFGGRSDIEVLAKLSGDISPKGYDLVQQTVRGSLSSTGRDDPRVERGAQDGRARSEREGLRRDGRAQDRGRRGALGSAKPAARARPRQPRGHVRRRARSSSTAATRTTRCSSSCPIRSTRSRWDNVAHVSKATAQALGVENGTLVRLTRAGAPRPIDIAMWITPGSGRQLDRPSSSAGVARRPAATATSTAST